jgi:hypothetical protein
MNWPQIVSGIKQIWENKPGVIVLLLLVFVVFAFLVVDARFHKQRHRRKHPKKY